MNRETLLQQYIYPLFQDEYGDFIELDNRIQLFSDSLTSDQIPHIGHIIKSFIQEYTRRYSDAIQTTHNMLRSNASFNEKQKVYFEELIEMGEVYKAAMIYYTQKAVLPKTKNEVLQHFDAMLEDRLDITCSQDTWNKIKGTMHKIIKQKADVSTPYNAIKYLTDTEKHKNELQIIEKVANTIYSLLEPKTIEYKGSKTFTDYDVEDLWEHEDLKNTLL